MKHKEGLSPVIGVILMVIIAIVISALFTVGMKFIYPEEKSVIETPKATLELKHLNDDFVVTITNITRKVDINETRWVILTASPSSIGMEGGETYYIYDTGIIGIIDGTEKEREDSKYGYLKSDKGELLTNATEYWEKYAPSRYIREDYKIPRINEPGVYGEGENYVPPDVETVGVGDRNRIIAFINNDEITEIDGWKISIGDQYIVRGTNNFGDNDKMDMMLVGFQLRLIFEPNMEEIATITLE